MLGLKKKPAEKEVLIVFQQGIAGQRTETDPVTGKVSVAGVWSFVKGDKAMWPAEEARTLVDRRIARYVVREEEITNIEPCQELARPAID